MTIELTPEVVPAEDPRLTSARARVLRAAAARAGICTPPAVEAAAALLVDLLVAGEQHGVTGDAWSAVTDLGGACIDVTVDLFRGVDHVQQQAAAQGWGSAADCARHLVDVLHGHLVDVRGVENTHRPGSYGVTFSTCGRVRRSVQCGADGWHYSLDGPGPVHSIYAPYTEQGAIAVADVIAELVAGTIPDPMTRR